MTDPCPEKAVSPLTAKAEAVLGSELPFGLAWIHVFNPAIITPRAWAARYGHARIYIEPPAGTEGGARIERYIMPNPTEVKDEVRFPRVFTKVTSLLYRYNEADELTEYPTAAPDAHLTLLIAEMAGLIRLPGATIVARNEDGRLESTFKNEGGLWIEQNTGMPIAATPYPTIAAGHLAINPPDVSQ